MYFTINEYGHILALVTGISYGKSGVSYKALHAKGDFGLGEVWHWDQVSDGRIGMSPVGSNKFWEWED